MNPEKDEEKFWKCEKCSKRFSSTSIDKIVMSLDEEKNKILRDPTRKKVKVIENFITKCMKVLDARNLIIIRMKYNLIGLYGRELGFSTQARIYHTGEKISSRNECCERFIESSNPNILAQSLTFHIF